MENSNNLNDKDLNRLLKHRLLELEDDALLETEAKLVFSSTVVVAPDIKKEEAFLKKIKKVKGRFWKWLFPGTGTFIGIVTLFCFYQHSGKHVIKERADNKQSFAAKMENGNGLQTGVYLTNSGSAGISETFLNPLLNVNAPTNKINRSKNENDTIITTFKSERLRIYKGQLLRNLQKENGDCSSPVTIKDSMIVLVFSPTGWGNELEISGNATDDEKYFEAEHNTAWYKLIVKENCKLAFDIAPKNEKDDFDFMLFQYNGPNFPLQVEAKRIAPIRTCISRDDTILKGKTGLNYDEQAPAFVHSDTGTSYVKYVRAEKGQVFYLVVDGKTLYRGSHGLKVEPSGYTIRFHYKEYNPEELYVGKSLATNIYFVPDKPEFLENSGSEAAIDSIYYFLKSHPKIKVEIQGHVNSIESQKLNGKKTPSQVLSERRARVVFNCLVADGIDPQRIIPIGYAGTLKKIKRPKTIAESSKNVRVDIVIRSLDYEADRKLMGQRTDKE
jgi:outer membrane protein OmpA-like peptidoglycan-associated protein